MGGFVASWAPVRIGALLCLPKVVYQCVGQLVHWSAELMMQLPADQLTICQGKQHQHCTHICAAKGSKQHTSVHLYITDVYE
jgi:hypothetical protein